MERIISDEGVLYRMKRSIQAEGSFGDIKQDMQFRRYLSKGNANVLAESTLLAIARNINKLHNKIQNGKTGTHLFPLKVPEFRSIKIKIFKTYIGLLKYANFWNIPFILINSNLSPVNKQLKATFIWFSFLSSSVQIKNQTVLVYTNLH